MAIILTGLAVTAVAVFVIPLAILRAGIRRQERCRCLACQPPGLAAALTRRLVGLSVDRPVPSACHVAQALQAEDEPLLVAGENEPHEGR
jgi:hypothetical protein